MKFIKKKYKKNNWYSGGGADPYRGILVWWKCTGFQRLFRIWKAAYGIPEFDRTGRN